MSIQSMFRENFYEDTYNKSHITYKNSDIIFIISGSCLRGEVDIMRPSEGRVTGSIPVGGAT